MSDLSQNIKDLTRGLDDIKKFFNIVEKNNELQKFHQMASAPDLWNDQDKARNLMQNLADLEQDIKEIEELENEVSTLNELSKDESLLDDLTREIEKTQKKLNKFKLRSYLSGIYDKKNAIVSIHAGQGGVEAMDWASMLYRMYLRFCEKKSWQTEVIDSTSGEEAGLKSVTFKVTGTYAYGYLKGEMGTHRLVRQSPFNADKLRETSFALVEVLPEFEDIDLPDIVIKDEDLEWQFFRASSQGGQNVQKVSTAVRLKHKPSGLVVTAQTERFQEQNRKIALNLMRAKLWVMEQEKAQATKKEIKGEYRPASWGTQIRSYVLHPYKMVKDLRTGVETSNPESVLDGELDEFIEAELMMVAGKSK